MTERKEENIGQRTLKRLWADTTGKDLSFSVEEKIVRCHRCIVQKSSDYFQKLLQSDSDFVESSLQEIPIKDISYDIFYSIIQYFYTNEIIIDHSNVWDLMKAAEIFLIESLNKICMKFIEEHLTPYNCWDLLTFTRTYRWKEDDNKLVALQYIARNPIKCKLNDSNESFSLNEWKLMIETASLQEKYLSIENKNALLGKFILSIPYGIYSREKSNISCIFEKAIPLFRTFCTVYNAVQLYRLEKEYECKELHTLAVGHLSNISKSKDILCSTSKSTFDSIIDDVCNYADDEHFASQCGHVILQWVNQNTASKDHTETLFDKYNKHIGKTLRVDNVMKIFRQARGCGSLGVEMQCLSFINNNVSSLKDDLIDTSVEEMLSISNAYTRSKKEYKRTRECYEKYASYELKVHSYSKLVGKRLTFKGAIMLHEKPITFMRDQEDFDETVYPPLKSFLENLHCINEMSQDRIKEVTGYRETYCFSYSRRAKDMMFKPDYYDLDTKPESFGEVFLGWINKNKGSKSETVESCVDALKLEHQIEIGYNLSSENIEMMYTMALTCNYQGLEALCFCHILENFKDSISLILQLPFTRFTSLLNTISKLYKRDVRVHSFLGQITTCWMSVISTDFKDYAEKILEFKDVSKLHERDNVTENMVLGRLGFLISEMLRNTDPEKGLIISLKIYAKLIHMRKGEKHVRILDCCLNNYPSIMSDIEFVNISAEAISRIISRGRDLWKDPPCDRNQRRVSETKIMESVLYWYTCKKSSNRESRIEHQRQNENNHERRQSFVMLFGLLEIDKIPLMQLLDVVEPFHFILDDENIRTKFFSVCRKHFKSQ